MVKSDKQRPRTKEEIAGALLSIVGLLGLPALIGLIIYQNRKR